MPTVRLDETTWSTVQAQAGTPLQLPRFLGAVKAALRDAEVEPMPGGWDVKGSLDAWMRVARFRGELPDLQAAAIGGEHSTEEALEAGRKLSSEAVTLGVWLSTRNAPTWIFAQLDAPMAFRAMAQAAYRAQDLSLSLHWHAGLLLLPSTLLGRVPPPGGFLQHDDVQHLLALQHELPAEALRDEIEAWHDLYTSYGLFSHN